MSRLAIALVDLSMTGLDPKQRRPGLSLRGDVATTLRSDCTFADKHQMLLVETHPWITAGHASSLQ